MNEADRRVIRDRLGPTGVAVKLLVFTQDDDLADPEQPPYPHCGEAVELMSEVAEIVDGIKVEVYERAKDARAFALYGVDDVPTVMPMTDRDPGIRFTGLPNGYEFASFIDTMAALRGEEPPDVSASVRERLDDLHRPIHLRVFYMPTDPNCPRAVRNAIQLARASDKIAVELVECTQFPELVETFQVTTVPRTFINNIAFFEGAGTVEDILDQIEAALRGEGFKDADEAAAPQS